MYNLIQSAISNERNKEYNFYLNGDLNQMATQSRFLNSCGIKTKQNNVYPCLKESDVKNALTLILERKVEGWWNYRSEYKKYGIDCTD